MPGMKTRDGVRYIVLKFLLAWLMVCVPLPSFALEPPVTSEEAPRVRAALEQAWAAESDQGYAQDIRLALVLYCHAGISGSSEGYYRIGRIFLEAPPDIKDETKARSYLAVAAQLGHERAAILLGEVQADAVTVDDCAEFERAAGGQRFDLARYIAGLSAQKILVAELIRQEADRQSISASLVLAVACAESNLEASAVSPKNAQGVMQLIPDTQQRFGVTKPFDPQQNVRGGVRYLKWLLKKFDGNIAHAVAAYNAGEGVVLRYKGIPPYAETQAYVRRVLFFSGLSSALARRP